MDLSNHNQLGDHAALTAAVATPWQFYTVRFLLGLAEAGFFPGILVFLTHWFPIVDRSRAISIFLIATPFAQIASPKISGALLRIGTDILLCLLKLGPTSPRHNEA